MSETQKGTMSFIISVTEKTMWTSVLAEENNERLGSFAQGIHLS